MVCQPLNVHGTAEIQDLAALRQVIERAETQLRQSRIYVATARQLQTIGGDPAVQLGRLVRMLNREAMRTALQCAERSGWLMTAGVLISESTPEIAPKIAPEIAPAIAPEIAPAIAPEIAPKIAPEVAPKTEPLAILTSGREHGTDRDRPLDPGPDPALAWVAEQLPSPLPTSPGSPVTDTATPLQTSAPPSQASWSRQTLGDPTSANPADSIAANQASASLAQTHSAQTHSASPAPSSAIPSPPETASTGKALGKSPEAIATRFTSELRSRPPHPLPAKAFRPSPTAAPDARIPIPPAPPPAAVPPQPSYRLPAASPIQSSSGEVDIHALIALANAGESRAELLDHAHEELNIFSGVSAIFEETQTGRARTQPRSWATQLRIVGSTLRHARRAQGLSIEALHARTYIPLQHLTAIERGDHAQLPAPVYVRGFVRRMAEALMLDSAFLLKQLEAVGDRPDFPRWLTAKSRPVHILQPWHAYVGYAALVAGGIGFISHSSHESQPLEPLKPTILNEPTVPEVAPDPQTAPNAEATETSIAPPESF